MIEITFEGSDFQYFGEVVWWPSNKTTAIQIKAEDNMEIMLFKAFLRRLGYKIVETSFLAPDGDMLQFVINMSKKEYEEICEEI